MNNELGRHRTDARPYVRWNLTALMLDVTFYSIGMAFIDPTAIMPLLLSHLGASGTIIGAFAALKSLGFNGFQILTAFIMHGRTRQKPALALIATLTRLPLLLMPIVMIHASESSSARRFALYGIIAILVLWSLGDGLGYVPWMEIVARAFEPKTRGRFFATSQIVSGLSSILIGLFAVRGILQNPHIPFPRSYSLLCGLAAGMFMVSLSGVLLIKEPPAGIDSGHRPDRLSAKDYFRAIPGLLHNSTFAKLTAVQLLLGFGSTSAQFYVLYAVSRFHLSDFWGGAYQAIQALGIVLLMPCWTFVSERRSSAAAIRAVGAAIVLTPLCALTVGRVGPLPFGIVFLLMGGSLGWGIWIVVNHYLLEHVSEQHRQAHVAAINLLYVPSAIFPYLGGMLVRGNNLLTFHGIPVVFLITTLVTSIGLLLSYSLPNLETAD
jgi:Major Facilitator Superfamily